MGPLGDTTCCGRGGYGWSNDIVVCLLRGGFGSSGANCPQWKILPGAKDRWRNEKAVELLVPFKASAWSIDPNHRDKAVC